MKHNWELLNGTFGCSRCGVLSGVETDADCPAISDGEIYQGKPLSDAEKAELSNRLCKYADPFDFETIEAVCHLSELSAPDDADMAALIAAAQKIKTREGYSVITIPA